MIQKDIKDLNTVEKDLELDLRDIYGLFKRNLKLITIITTSIVLASSFKIYTAKDIWQGSFDIVLSDEKSENLPISNLNLGSLSNVISSYNDELPTQLIVLKSPSVLLPIFEFVKKQKLMESVDYDSWNYINWSKQSLKIKLIEGTSVLNLKYKDTDKNLVIPVLNKISKVYQEYSNTKKSKSIDATIKYLNEQINIFEKNTKTSLNNLERYANKNDIVFDINTSSNASLSFAENPALALDEGRRLVSPNVRSQLFKSQDIELARIQATNKIKKIESLQKQISSIDENSGEFSFILQNLETYRPDLRIEILKLENSLSRLRSVYKEGSKPIKLLKMQLSDLRKLSKNELINYLQASKKNQLSVQDSLKRPIEVLLKYKELLFETTQNDETLRRLKNQRASALLKKQEDSKPWDLITSPTVLPKPVGPPRGLYMLYAFLGGLVSGIFISLVKERKDDLIYKSETIKNILNIENLTELSFKNINNFDLSINIISNNITSNQKIKSVEIIPLGKVKNQFQKYILKKFKENIEESEIKDLSKINYENEFYGKIFIFESGAITKKELIEFSKVINLFKSKSFGFLFIKQ